MEPAQDKAPDPAYRIPEEGDLEADSKERHRRFAAIDMTGYIPPQLHRTKVGWYIDYYVRDPRTGRSARRRVKVNRIKDQKARLLYARQVITEITLRLASGWTPWAEKAGAAITMEKALLHYDQNKVRQLRHSSPYSISSMISVLLHWLRSKDLHLKYAHQIERRHIGGFLEYITDVRLVGNRTYNNYLIFLATLFKWMIEHDYISVSPLENFSRRKELRKSRTYLTDQERREMVSWIRQNDPDFLIPCLFIYGTLIRPGELRRLRVRHVNLERQVVFLPAEETKSGIERTPAIPDWMRDVLKQEGFDDYPEKCWLVGKRLTPGENPIARNTLNRHWVRMRSELMWDQSRQLYSLRDTGIIQLIRDGVDLLHVMQQAGHTEIATTNKYLKHAFPNGPAEVRAKATPLFAASPLVE